MRLLHQEHTLHHHHHHPHHQHEQEQEQEHEQEVLQQQQADHQELQRQRILSLFESSPPPPEPSEDPLPVIQPSLSFDLFSLPKPGAVPRAVEAAPLDFAESGGGVESQATVGTGVGADVQVRKRRGRPPRLNGGGCGPVMSSLTGRREDEEEDVCFICFDGGTLVLCDRR